MKVNPSNKKEDTFSSQRKRRNDKKEYWDKILCSCCGNNGNQIDNC
jgi:hypothetical protein